MKTRYRILCLGGNALMIAITCAQGAHMGQSPERPILRSPVIGQLSQYIAGHTLTIDDAVKLTLAINRTMAQARANLYVFEGKTSEAYAALNPTLSTALEGIQLNKSIQNKYLTVLDPATLNQPIGKEYTTYNLDQKFVGVTAELPIDINGTIRAAASQAKFEELGYRLDVNRTRNQIVSDVKGAFYDALRAQALVKVAEENLKNSQDRLKDAQDRLAARVVTKFDVLRAQTDVAAAQQQLIVAHSTEKTDIAILNSVIGVKVDTAELITDNGAVVVPSQPASDALQEGGQLGPEFDSDLKEALLNRPELQEADAFESAAKKGIDVARRTQLPSLNLSWSYLYAPDAGGSNPIYHSWVAEALFSIPIFDGGVARARVKEAKGSLYSAEVSKRQAIDQVTLEAEQAFLAVNEAQQRVSVAEATLVEATEAFKLAQVRYKAGVTARTGLSPLLELSDAQNALTLAESNRVNALYDYNSANARLDRALGRYSFAKG